MSKKIHYKNMNDNTVNIINKPIRFNYCQDIIINRLRNEREIIQKNPRGYRNITNFYSVNAILKEEITPDELEVFKKRALEFKGISTKEIRNKNLNYFLDPSILGSFKSLINQIIHVEINIYNSDENLLKFQEEQSKILLNNFIETIENLEDFSFRIFLTYFDLYFDLLARKRVYFSVYSGILRTFNLDINTSYLQSFTENSSYNGIFSQHFIKINSFCDYFQKHLLQKESVLDKQIVLQSFGNLLLSSGYNIIESFGINYSFNLCFRLSFSFRLDGLNMRGNTLFFDLTNFNDLFIVLDKEDKTYLVSNKYVLKFGLYGISKNSNLAVFEFPLDNWNINFYDSDSDYFQDYFGVKKSFAKDKDFNYSFVNLKASYVVSSVRTETKLFYNKLVSVMKKNNNIENFLKYKRNFDSNIEFDGLKSQVENYSTNISSSRSGSLINDTLLPYIIYSFLNFNMKVKEYPKESDIVQLIREDKFVSSLFLNKNYFLREIIGKKESGILKAVLLDEHNTEYLTNYSNLKISKDEEGIYKDIIKTSKSSGVKEQFKDFNITRFGADPIDGDVQEFFNAAEIIQEARRTRI
jgi:hypothetical protein